MELQVIRQKIYEIRGQKVMLDFDLAELYGVETRAFNQAVKRNIERFPEDFMFQLTVKEWRRSQVVTSSDEEIPIDNQSDANPSTNVMSSMQEMMSQSVISSQKKRKLSSLPYAFTEHGVSMLASVLRSEKAVQMSIAIVRAFIALKEYAAKRDGLELQIRAILDRLEDHDAQLNSIYSAIENLLSEKAEKKAEELRWRERERIGYKQSS
jgi:phage regulator Rha-like protein